MCWMSATFGQLRHSCCGFVAFLQRYYPEFAQRLGHGGMSGPESGEKTARKSDNYANPDVVYIAIMPVEDRLFRNAGVATVA